MKLFKSILILTCLAFSSCSLFEKPVTTQINFANNCSSQQQEEAHLVIIDRVKMVYGVEDFTNPENGSFSINHYLKEDVEILPDLLTRKGEVAIYESYLASEIKDMMLNGSNLKPLKDSILYDLITTHRHTYTNNNLSITEAYKKDIKFIDSLLYCEEIKQLFPEDISFLWMKTDDFFSENIYSLIAIKKNHFIPLNKKTVKEAKASISQYTAGLELFFEFYPDYGQKWAAFTKNNIGKYLPIVCDGNVLSAPMVNNEITGGKSVITGKLTDEEIYTILGFIKSTALNCLAYISDSKDIEKQN